MQISFRLDNSNECKAASILIDAAAANVLNELAAMVVQACGQLTPTQATEVAHAGPVALVISADTNGQIQERSAADVFQSAAPLSPALLAAGATPLPIAPVGMPDSSVPTRPDTLPLAPTGPAPVAPSTGALAVPASASGAELDVQGIPWDHRIHASTKTRNADGKWKKLKGLNDDAKYNAIVAELKALHAMPVQQTLPAMPPVPSFPNTVVLPAVVALAPTTPLPAALAPAPAAVDNFDGLMYRVTPAIAAGILPQDVLSQACTARQLAGPIALITRPDFVPQIYADLRAAYPAFS